MRLRPSTEEPSMSLFLMILRRTTFGGLLFPISSSSLSRRLTRSPISYIVLDLWLSLRARHRRLSSIPWHAIGRTSILAGWRRSIYSILWVVHTRTFSSLTNTRSSWKTRTRSMRSTTKTSRARLCRQILRCPYTTIYSTHSMCLRLSPLKIILAAETTGW